MGNNTGNMINDFEGFSLDVSDLTSKPWEIYKEFINYINDKIKNCWNKAYKKELESLKIKIKKVFEKLVLNAKTKRSEIISNNNYYGKLEVIFGKEITDDSRKELEEITKNLENNKKIMGEINEIKKEFELLVKDIQMFQQEMKNQSFWNKLLLTFGTGLGAGAAAGGGIGVAAACKGVCGAAGTLFAFPGGDLAIPIFGDVFLTLLFCGILTYKVVSIYEKKNDQKIEGFLELVTQSLSNVVNYEEENKRVEMLLGNLKHECKSQIKPIDPNSLIKELKNDNMSIMETLDTIINFNYSLNV